MRAVLIIVDMLNDFFEQSPVLANERARLVARTNLLVRGFRSAGLPVFWIRQEFASDLHDAFPEMRAKKVSITIAGTTGCELLSELDCLPVDSVIVKKRYSAFFGTDLDARLLKLRPDFVVVAGVNTHACVRMTAVDAYQRDHEVVVAADCVASNDPEHHDVTLRYLDGKIGRVLPAAEILSLIKAPPNPALQRT
jgi:nicotinamidase-related amidase